MKASTSNSQFPTPKCRERVVWGLGVGGWELSLMQGRPEVLAEQIAPEVAPEIAPHRVNVIRVVLRVVEFNQEGRALHAIVVFLAALDRSRPRERDVVGSGDIELRP